jgi:acetoin utilization deacetylase AcuC-like enzyme
MRAARETAIVEDPRFLEHVGPDGHPERPERLAAVRAAVAGREHALRSLAPRPATEDEILSVHSREHLATVAASVQQAPARLDPDTFVSAGSLDAALLAAGASIDLALQVASRDVATGLAAVRPPGHHAESERAMGFCLFNNVAIAARALQREAGAERIAIIDWDVHHGNGTQHSFEADPTVLYASTHQFPFYPGTGSAGESGIGRGEGFTLNVPMPAGCGDPEYVGVFEHLIAPALQAFRPEMMLISCGFDAHVSDPLAAMTVSAEGYRSMTAIVRELADDLCGGRLAFVLEGGYAAEGLTEGVGSVLDQIMGDDPTASPHTGSETASGGAPERKNVLESVMERVRSVHGRDFSRLTAS